MLSAGMFLGSRYEIVSRIGSGGMADVYKAKDHKLNRFVAVKILKAEFSADQAFLSKFRMEAQSAACLSHPNIVNVYDVGEDQGVHYIVMELIDGITLKKYIERKKKLEIRESIEVAMQVARGLEAAHRQHIIHRDIKPQNIMISRDGKVKVTDFGIARASSTQTIRSNTMGSVHYISPEQARGGYCDERSDIYSLGITMYEMLTGRVPFEGESAVSVALLHIQGEMIPPREYEPLIPVSLEKIILKCTQKKPELRYSSATELIEDLKKSLTMPNENFVKIATLNPNSPTMVFSGEDTDQIQREANDRDDLYDEDEDLDDEEEEYDDEYEDEYDRDQEGDRVRRNRMERIVTIVSLIVVGLILILVLVFFFLRSCGAGSGADGEETSAAEETVGSVAMVNLLGISEEEAVHRLETLGLNYLVEYGTSDQVEIGEVYEQEYKEGSFLSPGTVVTIKVNSGKVSVPALVGYTENQARERLSAVSLTCEVSYQTSSEVEEGVVISQSPAEGREVEQNQTVTITVSSGPSGVTVPDLLYMSRSDAKSRLEAAGLTLGSVTQEYSDSDTEGLVIDQSIEAGENVSRGTSVDIVIGLGPKPAAETTQAPTTSAPTTSAPTQAPTEAEEEEEEEDNNDEEEEEEEEDDEEEEEEEDDEEDEVEQDTPTDTYGDNGDPDFEED